MFSFGSHLIAYQMWCQWVLNPGLNAVEVGMNVANAAKVTIAEIES